jgi:hypothetical protein
MQTYSYRLLNARSELVQHRFGRTCEFGNELLCKYECSSLDIRHRTTAGACTKMVH